ncbi:MAG: HAD-IB family phosphatase [Candidatus Aenigmatarchaeota archaeon]
MVSVKDVKLIVFDLESVLFDKYVSYVNGEMVEMNSYDLIFYELGAWEENQTLIELWKKGILQDYFAWNEETFKVWKEYGLKKNKFKESVKKMPLRKEAKEIVGELKRMGYKIATVTGSAEELALRAKRELGLDYAFAHYKLYFDKKGNLKDWNLFPTDYEDKVKCVKKIAKKEKISLMECAYVGDGENDIFVMSEVGVPIAFKPESEKVKNVARYVIEDLRELLDLLNLHTFLI